VYSLLPKFYGTEYSYQKGTKSSGTTVTDYDPNDYMVYSSVNFGPSGTTKGLLINFAKNNYGGKVEIRLGSGTNGKIIAEMNPAHSGGWGKFMTAHVGLIDDTVTGLQDITFVGKDKNGVMNLAWFELSDFSDREDVFSRIPASAFSNQSGTRFGGNTVGWFDAGDYLRYSNINFGPAGTTKNIKLRYAKANTGGKVQIRLGDPNTGTLIARFTPERTGGWGNWVEVDVPINDDVSFSGIQDLTFVATNKSGVMNMEWFELAP
jgi:hypothetical protein